MKNNIATTGKQVILAACLMLCGCSGNGTSPGSSGADSSAADTSCLCPHAQIVLQPYENYTRREAEALLPTLQKHFGRWLVGHWTFTIADPQPLPKESYVSSRGRYRVTPILNVESGQLKGGEVIIGLTHKDICTDIHGKKDYGIVGISRPLKQVCLVSDKRLSHKSDFWKPVMHEFIHTFYGSMHCPNNDPTCFMKDAQGHGNFRVQNRLCDSCRHD